MKILIKSDKYISLLKLIINNDLKFDASEDYSTITIQLDVMGKIKNKYFKEFNDIDSILSIVFMNAWREDKTLTIGEICNNYNNGNPKIIGNIRHMYMSHLYNDASSFDLNIPNDEDSLDKIIEFCSEFARGRELQIEINDIGTLFKLVRFTDIDEVLLLYKTIEVFKNVPDDVVMEVFGKYLKLMKDKEL